MKTKKIYNLVLAGLLMTFLISGCTGDFQDINTNRRVLSQLDRATIGNVFAYVEFGVTNHHGYFQISQNLFADLYAQFYANTQTKFPSDRNILVGGWLNAAWRGCYRETATNLDVVLKKTNPKYVEGLEKEYAVAQIMKVYHYQKVSDYWGPIPYSQVGNLEASVPYDAQDAIYYSFFDLLDSANAVISKGGNAYGSNDQIYGGDLDKWLKFSNSLRLRIALRISKVDPGRAKQEAEKAVSGGVIESVDDNAIFHVTDNSYNYLNRMVPWNEFRMSATMESLLKGYDDPRMPGYFSPTVNSVNAGTPEWRGLRNGYTIAGLSADDLHYDNLSMLGPRWAVMENRGKNNIEIIMASEVWFLRAEGALIGWNMGTTPKEAYINGITTSMEYWGIEPATIAAYIASANTPIATHDAPQPVSDVPVAWVDGDTDMELQQILTQKWLALFPDGWEAWADLRRANLPKLYERIASDNPDVPKDAMMSRVTYVDSEYSTNAEGVAQGIQLLGGPDKGSTKLWWDVD